MLTATDKKKEISQLPPGATGYELKTAEQYCNELTAAGVVVTEASDYLKPIKPIYAFPEHCNPLPFLKVKDQERIGACAGYATAQSGEGCQWIKTQGAVRRFSGWAQYYLAQEKGGMLGRDVGSMPSDNAWVAQNIGNVPLDICPRKPTVYAEGWRVTEAMRAEAGKYKIGAIARATKVEHLFKFMQTGQGYGTIGSIWPAHFDQNKMQPITSFFGPRRNDQHGGGHMYSVMGWYNHPQYGLCALIVNSWNTHWGDDGARLITVRALQEMFSHKFTITLLWSDMQLAKRQARKIEFSMGDFF